jgi:hypothetical protein
MPDDFAKTTVPPEYLNNLNYFRGDVSHLLEMIVALGGEVFVLKAEVERLRRELAAGDIVSDAQLEQRGRSDDFKKWIAEEQKHFAETLLDPIARARDIVDPANRVA